MKGRNIYILCIVGFLLIVIVSQLMRPKPFSWVNTYGAHDKNPFGSYVSDSLLRQALPAGYSVKNLSWHQIKTDSAARRSNLLFTQSAFTLIEDCIDDLLEMVDSGMNVCIAANSFHYHLMDTLGFSVDWQSYSETSLRRMIQEKSVVDTIQWQKGGSFGKRNFIVNSGLLYSTTFAFDNNDKDPWKKEAILVGDEYGADDYYVVVDSVDKKSIDIEHEKAMHETDMQKACIMSHRYGRGKIVLVSYPLLFTNYGMLHGENAQLVLRTLSLLDTSRPTIRITDTVERINEDGVVVETETPLSYFIMNKPLQWALYLALALILLYMILHLRRRQRAIPVIKDPENRQLEFAQLIGTLYFQKGDHADLLKKKYNYFAEHLRRELFVDIDNPEDDSDNFQRIAQMTAIGENEIRGYITAIRKLVKEEQPVDTNILHMYVEKMNQIIQATH